MYDEDKLPSLTNEIWVTEFNEKSAQKFRDRVVAQAEESSEDPIIIYIDSYGGYVDSLAKMIETLDEIPNPIITVCMGKAMSCGAILFSHGDIRYCGRHSRIMIHEVSGLAYGDVHDMHADAIETKRLNRYFLGMLAKNCEIEGGYDGLRKIIKARDGRDLYLDADAAVQFGIADFVGVPKVIEHTNFQALSTPVKRRGVNIKKSMQKPDKKPRGNNVRRKK